MKVIKIIGIFLLAVVVLTLIFLVSLKGEAHFERSITINKPPEKVFIILQDISHSKKWNPWMSIDTAANYVYSENTIGVGAKYTWESENKKVGNGEQEITEIRENEYINTSMSFGQMQGDYSSAFILEEIENGTKLTWTYEGSSDVLIEKFFIDYLIDSMLAPMYEKGLKNIKKYIEELPNPIQEDDEFTAKIDSIQS